MSLATDDTTHPVQGCGKVWMNLLTRICIYFLHIREIFLRSCHLIALCSAWNLLAVTVPRTLHRLTHVVWGRVDVDYEINSSTAVLPLRLHLIPAVQLRNKYQQNSLYNPDSNACNSIAAKRQVQSHSPDSASHTNMLPFWAKIMQCLCVFVLCRNKCHLKLINLILKIKRPKTWRENLQ